MFKSYNFLLSCSTRTRQNVASVIELTCDCCGTKNNLASDVIKAKWNLEKLVEETMS